MRWLVIQADDRDRQASPFGVQYAPVCFFVRALVVRPYAEVQPGSWYGLMPKFRLDLIRALGCPSMMAHKARIRHPAAMV
jgi:hypothetical protein